MKLNNLRAYTKAGMNNTLEERSKNYILDVALTFEVYESYLPRIVIMLTAV